MDLILLVLVLGLIGFAVHVLTTHVPMPPEWAAMLRVVALVSLLLYLVSRVVDVPNVLR